MAPKEGVHLRGWAHPVRLLRRRAEKPVSQPLERDPLALDLRREVGRGGDRRPNGPGLLGGQWLLPPGLVDETVERSDLQGGSASVAAGFPP